MPKVAPRIAISLLSYAVFAALGLSFIRASSPTYDEPVHLASGYTDLNAGIYRLNALDHPPFAEMWAALPLTALRPATFYQSPDWLLGRIYNYADSFLYRNRVPPETLLNWARAWALLSWGALIGAVLFLWSYRLGGLPALAAAGILFPLCPVLLSNAALVTTDAPAAALFFASFYVLSLPRRRPGHWIGAGALAGLALGAKFSMAVLPPLVLACVAAEGIMAKKDNRAWKFPLGPFCLMLAVSAFAIAAVYRFKDFPLFFTGLKATGTRLGQGRSSFLMGRYSTSGWLWYFPAAFLIKSPLPLLVGSAWGLARLWRKPSSEWIWAALPPSAYFLLACFSKTQIGIRHLLPVYPFAMLLAALAASELARRPWGKAVLAAAGLWLAGGEARVHPHELAYFNELAGGPGGGWRLLADSNLDWGQDLRGLGRILKSLGDPPVALSYFGVADPAHYGIRYAPLAFVTNVDRSRRSGTLPPGRSQDIAWLAVSATNLQGVYYPGHSLFAWLKSRKAWARPGWSIFLYNLKDDAEARRRVEAMLAQGPAAR